MPDIKCPNCGTVFSVDDMTYASISKQVRDKEFEKELKSQKAAAVKLVEMEKDQEIAALQAKVDSFQTELELAVRNAVDEKQRVLGEKEREIIGLQAKLDNQKQAADADKEAAIHLAEAQKDKLLAELHGQLSTMKSEYTRKEAELIADRDRLIQLKDEEIAHYKEMKARLSTKMVGESLEQHCETEFNKVRALGFPMARFEKDNDVRSGSKGDFIFRDFDEDGEEYISIMFDTKT